MPNLANSSNPTRFKVLQVGESGNGKTHRAATATAFGPTYFFDFDDKLEALAPKLPAEQKELIEYDVFTDYISSQKKLAELQAACPYSTIVVDTWSRLHDLEIDYHRQKIRKPPEVKFTFEDWGVIKSMNKEFVRQLLSLPCNVIINCHVGKRMDASDNLVLTVGTTGSFGQELPSYFQETHYLFYELGQFKVKACKTSKIVANTGLPESYYDKNGIFKDLTLNIFKDIAYRVPTTK